MVEVTPDITISTDPEKRRKVYVDGVRATIVAERVEYLDENGKLITESLRDFTKNSSTRARRVAVGSEAEQEFLLVTNRKLIQAGEALDDADEAEEFQAVGMRCRECLLALIKEIRDGSDLGEGDANSAAGPPAAGLSVKISSTLIPAPLLAPFALFAAHASTMRGVRRLIQWG